MTSDSKCNKLVVGEHISGESIKRCSGWRHASDRRQQLVTTVLVTLDAALGALFTTRNEAHKYSLSSEESVGLINASVLDFFYISRGDKKVRHEGFAFISHISYQQRHRERGNDVLYLHGSGGTEFNI
jgi:hypothetical protein